MPGYLHPEAYNDFLVYRNDIELIGTAKVTLPTISYLGVSITGAGITGTINAVLAGMVDQMVLGLDFRNPTDGAVLLTMPEAQLITIRAAEQFWNARAGKKEILADKYVCLAHAKSTNPGTLAPAAMADTHVEMDVYRYEGYKDGKTLWKVDPMNRVCEINGVDYLATTRAALGLN